MCGVWVENGGEILSTHKREVKPPLRAIYFRDRSWRQSDRHLVLKILQKSNTPLWIVNSFIRSIKAGVWRLQANVHSGYPRKITTTEGRTDRSSKDAVINSPIFSLPFLTSPWWKKNEWLLKSQFRRWRCNYSDNTRKWKDWRVQPCLFNLNSHASLNNNYSSKEGKVRGFDGTNVWNESGRLVLRLETDTVLILLYLLSITIEHTVIWTNLTK